MTSQTARVALVGDRSPDVLAHTRIPAILDALRDKDGVTLDAQWVPTTEAFQLDGFDGVWMLPGSPYQSEAGALAAARKARTGRIPLLGTCGGFQHAVMEFARGACGLEGRHAETEPDAEDVVIQALACSLAGQEGRVHLTPGSLVASIMGEGPAPVRYNCSYGINPAHRSALEEHGLRFTGHDDQGEIRVAEMGDHPFFLLSLFQPELAEEIPHPVIRAFAAAAVTRALT